MRPLILCRERLDRIIRILGSRDGAFSVRELWRTHGIRDWEVEQAAALGWLSVAVIKPRVGRPSKVVEFRGYKNAKLPVWRGQQDTEFSPRHFRFAVKCGLAVKHGARSFGVSAIVDAYVDTYNPRSRKGAYASASRLWKHRDVRAIREWFQAVSNYEIPPDETMPQTATGIRKRFRELNNPRANRFY